MPPNCHEAYYWMTTYVSQGSAATDLRAGDSFNSVFLRRSFLNLTVKNYENWSTSNKVLPFGAMASGNYDSPCSNNFASSTALAEVCALLSVILVEMTLHLHSYLQGIDPGVTRGQISPNMERMGHRYRCPLPKVLACYENLCEWYHGYVITADTAGNTENGVYSFILSHGEWLRSRSLA